MKDSRIGAYGVIALVLSLGLRATALAAVLTAPGALTALVVIGVSSRLPMVLLMAALPTRAARDWPAKWDARPRALLGSPVA